MELLGAEVFEEDGTIRAKADHPKGAVLCFPKKSVGATENAVLFAVGAEGATRLEHCAREPEVVHLCRFLKAVVSAFTSSVCSAALVSSAASPFISSFLNSSLMADPSFSFLSQAPIHSALISFFIFYCLLYVRIVLKL